MRILNKLVYACCSIAFGLMALPSCEGGELYDVNAPDWISEKVDSIANSKKDPEEEVLEGMQEDVYSFGNTDYTSGFWTAFSKYYVVPDGQKWHGVFNLNICLQTHFLAMQLTGKAVNCQNALIFFSICTRNACQPTIDRLRRFAR